MAQQIVFRIILDESGVSQKLKRITDEAEIARLKIEDPASLYILSAGAHSELQAVQVEAQDVKQKVEEPAEVKVNATQALATIRDLTIAVQGTIAAVKTLISSMGSLMDSALQQRQAEKLTGIAFRESADSMKEFASAMQSVTNYGDEALLPLMARLAQTFNLSASEVKLLTPALLDFTEANKAAGMNLETAFNLFGRALAGNTTMLSRYGIQLDDTRLKTEGVAYLVEKLNEDYGGTAEALADLRLQNANTWGDIQETLGSFIDTIVEPILRGLKWIMEGWQSLSTPMQAIIAGIVLAIPVITTLTATIGTLTAAFAALKTVMNPVAGLISGIAAATTVGAFAYAAYATSTDDATNATDGFADTQLSVEEVIRSSNREISVQAEKFELLANRLLELRSSTSLTRQEKLELQNVIRTMNAEYGDLLQNIDLETTSYERLRNTLQGVSENLLKKQIAEVYGEKYQAQMRKAAKLQVRLNELVETARQKQLQFAEERRMLEGGPGDYNKLSSEAFHYQQIANTRVELEKAKEDLEKFAVAYQQAMDDITNIVFTPSGGGAAAAASTALSEAQRLIEELARLRLSETERVEQEYQRRLKIIQDATAAESEAQITAIANLNAWKEDEDAKIEERHTQSIQNQFRSDIDYYSNLQSLGVASYDALKEAMEAYYEWAVENLPQKEQELIQAQIQEATLRRQEQVQEERDRELAELHSLQDIRDAFLKRNEELEGNSYDSRIRELERFYERNHDAMVEAGISEIDIAEQKEAAILAIKMEYAERGVKGVSGILSNLAAMQNKESKRGFKAWKQLSIAQATIDGLAAANAAYKALAGIPVVGPALGVAAAAAALFAAATNIDKIGQMEYEPPTAARGGYIEGPSHARGGVIIEAEGDEYITSARRVKELGKPLFDFLNFGPLTLVKDALDDLKSILALRSMPSGSAATSMLADGPISQIKGTIESLKSLFSLPLAPEPVERSVSPSREAPATAAQTPGSASQPLARAEISPQPSRETNTITQIKETFTELKTLFVDALAPLKSIASNALPSGEASPLISNIQHLTSNSLARPFTAIQELFTFPSVPQLAIAPAVQYIERGALPSPHPALPERGSYPSIPDPSDLLREINQNLRTIAGLIPDEFKVDVHVDPLDPVAVSELNDQGNIIRNQL